MITTVVAFIIIFSVLILVHEFGHFIMARRAGIKVEEFGIGLPPQAKPLFKDKKGTVYSLNWIPFGGFVRMYGEDVIDPKILKDKKSFASKTLLQRTSVVVAGVAMNFLLAWLLISFGFTFGMKPFLANQQDVENAVEAGTVEVMEAIYIHDIIPGSPISNTEISAGDVILAVNGVPVGDADHFVELLSSEQTDIITVALNADVTRKKDIEVTKNAEGMLGIQISTMTTINPESIQDVRYPFYIAPIQAAKEVGRISWLTVKMLGNVVTSLVVRFTIPEGVSGPVGIAKMTHYFAKEGFMSLVHFTALISISLGVINIMPFPALDGGRFIFIIIEAITRRKPNAKAEKIIHASGFALLMLLILVITWNDIINLF